MSFCCVFFPFGVVGTKSLCEGLNVNSSTELSNLSADEGFFLWNESGIAGQYQRYHIWEEGVAIVIPKSYIRLDVINQHM